MEWDKDSIRAFRKKLNLNRGQFAKLLGTSSTLILYWEKGERNPGPMSREFLSLIAEKEDIQKDIEEIKEKKQKEDRITSDAIKAFREKLSLSQTEFAEKLERDLSTISYWESGKRHPGEESIRRMKVLAKEEGIELSFDAQAGKIPESEGKQEGNAGKN